MRQNPINTAAGKSRKAPWIPSDQHTPEHTEHTPTGFDSAAKRQAGCQSENQREE